jgi:hypothetical protein
LDVAIPDNAVGVSPIVFPRATDGGTVSSLGRDWLQTFLSNSYIHFLYIPEFALGAL